MYPAANNYIRRQSNTVIAASSSQRIALSGASYVRISCAAQAIWYKFGDSTVAATAGTANEGFIPAGYPVDIVVPGVDGSAAPTHIAIIQDAATAKGSVSLFG